MRTAPPGVSVETQDLSDTRGLPSPSLCVLAPQGATCRKLGEGGEGGLNTIKRNVMLRVMIDDSHHRLISYRHSSDSDVCLSVCLSAHTVQYAQGSLPILLLGVGQARCQQGVGRTGGAHGARGGHGVDGC